MAIFLLSRKINKYIEIGAFFVLFLFLGIFSVKASNQKELLVKYYSDDNYYAIPVKENLETELAEYKKNEKVEQVEENYNYHVAIIPSDTYFSNQWYLKRIKAVEAWDKKREVPEITIAIIDTGVQISHQDLKDNIWRNIKEIAGNGVDDDKNGYIDDVNGWDFVNGVNDPEPKFNKGYTFDGIIHGTVVAGIAAGFGNNGTGISGVAWQAKIMALKVLDDQGEGDTRKVVQAIDYAVQNGADVINLSFVGYGYSQILNDAIRRAYNKGVFVVAAAGNDEGQGGGVNIDEKPIYPACHDGGFGENMVIGVSATDPLDQKAPFSSFGSRCVDIAAPGVSIFSTTVFSPEHNTVTNNFDKRYDGFWSGTSMATPMVSGALALTLGTYPRLGTKGIRNIMLKTAYNINALNPAFIGKLGSGRLDVSATLHSLNNIIKSKNDNILVAPATNKEPIVIIESHTGNKKSEFFVYDKNFQGGVNVASGDVDGDGVDEIIVGAGNGGGPHIKIFKANGQVQGQFFAYDKNFRDGVNVVSGDVDGDGVDEIIAGAGNGGGPHIRIFKANGQIQGQFFAYDKNFRGGVNVAVGDVDGDGVDEIIAGAGIGGGPHVKVFSARGQLKGHFMAFNDSNRNGVNVSAGFFNSGLKGTKASIVVAESINGEPIIKIFNLDGVLEKQFLVFQKKFKGGINLSTGDFNKDGFDEIVVAAGPGGAPHIRVFTSDGILLSSYYAYETDFEGGVKVSAINLK